MLKVGDKAPLFEAKDQNGNTIRLEDLLKEGKKIVLYFYPKDDTPGCTKQACNLRDHYQELLDAGYLVVGVSVDDEASHQKFIEKYQLPFPLIADTDHQLVEAYGVWKEKNMYGRKYWGTARTTFVINPDGTIERIIKRPKTQEHAEEILKGSK
ncbi:thioredoxin-dependent thiol peroxidase [Thermonema rossianum]|jgi:peroxiredoxin Q/BCP|uniref:thioredoxin-dependent thiol peroxidase n=1 Tax=Thermonema rossianum TaxID=55505 RepID=UPI0005711F16|nr:thioredoxin-dependent thiol peroxidase [Thermonema rossianum]